MVSRVLFSSAGEALSTSWLLGAEKRALQIFNWKLFPFEFHFSTGNCEPLSYRDTEELRPTSAPRPSTEPRLMACPATTAGLCLGLAEESLVEQVSALEHSASEDL